MRRSFGPVLSAVDGRFEFRELPAGRYEVSAFTSGFLRWRYRQRAMDDRDIATVDVADGQIVDNIEMALPRGGVVTGRVVDGEARPVANIGVRLVRREFSLGRIELLPLSNAPLPGGEGFAALTNDRGEYQLFGVPPGDYFVVASSLAPREASWIGPNGLRVAYANTFYPGATGPSTAARLFLGFADVRHDITIRRVTVPVFEIRGYVIDKTGERVSSGRVQALSRGNLSHGSFGLGLEAEARIQPTGEFVLTNVRPGRYSVRVLLEPPDLRAGSAVERRINSFNSMGGVAVDVNNEDLTGLRLAAPGLAHVRGSVVFDDATATASIVPAAVCATPTVWDADDGWLGVGTLVATPGSRDMYLTGTTGSGYQFEWTTMTGHIGATAYLCAERLTHQRTWHVKEIRANGRDVTDSGFDVDAVHPPDLQIVLTNQQPRLTGLVMDASGSPRANRVVIVFAQDRTRWSMSSSRYVAVVFTDGSGRYRATVPAGDYYVAATEQGTMGSWTDPEFLASLVPHALRVSLRERARASWNLTVASLPVSPLR
jgi:hypothetical protein